MRFAMEHPEDFEERIEAMIDHADNLRDIEAEEAILSDQDERHCPRCGGGCAEDMSLCVNCEGELAEND